MSLPVTVDCADPTRVEVRWEEVPTIEDRRREATEAAAADMRGEGNSPAD
jgi:hypothetical protein